MQQTIIQADLTDGRADISLIYASWSHKGKVGLHSYEIYPTTNSWTTRPTEQHG